MRKPPESFQKVAAQVKAAAQNGKAAAIKRAADKYERIAPEIRASIAKRAQVKNKRLDELDRDERRKMKDETERLINSLQGALGQLIASLN